MQCACAILSSLACRALQYFSTLSHKRRDFRKQKALESKMCVLSSSAAFVCNFYHYKKNRARYDQKYTGLFISPSGISELECATTKTDTAERSKTIGRESLQVFFLVLGALAYFQVPPLGGSCDEKWRSQ